MEPIEIKKYRLNTCHEAHGLVVVIDVMRAFTTAAYAFAAGVEKIILVQGIEEAFSLHKQHPSFLLLGEQRGIQVPGFHFGNSPIEISQAAVKGKTLIQRTSAGTQGTCRVQKAERMLVSSFVIAEATLKTIRQATPAHLSFVITGSRDGDEDLSLADYLEAHLTGQKPNSTSYLERVKHSPSGQVFADPAYPEFPKADLDAALLLNRFSFAIEVTREPLGLTARPLFNPY